MSIKQLTKCTLCHRTATTSIDKKSGYTDKYLQYYLTKNIPFDNV